MGYNQPNNPIKMMKSGLKMHKDQKKLGMHRDSALYAHHESPANNVNKGYPSEIPSPMNRESAELKDMPIVDIEKGDAKGSPATAARPDFLDVDGDGNKKESMKEAAESSPATKYDRVVLGGNKGDKSKTKPGKEDYKK